MEDKLKLMTAPNTAPNDQVKDQRNGQPGGGPGAGHESSDPGLRGMKARQGETSGRIRKVLAVSTGLAAAALLGTWWFFV